MSQHSSREQIARFRRVLGACLIAISLSSCSKHKANEPPPEIDNGGNVSQGDPSTTPTPPPSAMKYEALAWESSSKPERRNWSSYAMQIAREEYDKLDQADDANFFCPRFASLSRDQRINFWGQLVAGITFYESGWNPLSRMHETTMGTDPVTGLPVYSEGLLQLSYQDIQWAPYCEFEWNKDKYLSPNDPKKTILDPYRNLRCGIKILANQVASRKQIVLSSGVYWAVLKKNGAYERIDEIASITKKLSFCR